MSDPRQEADECQPAIRQHQQQRLANSRSPRVNSAADQCPDRCCYCCHLFSRRVRRFDNENLLILSVIQILCGLAAIVLHSVSIAKEAFQYKLGVGIWSGVLMIATGLHGMVTTRRKIPCTLISLLVLCVVVAITAVLLAAVSVAGLVRVLSSSKMPSTDDQETVHLVLYSLLLVIGCLETGVSIATAIVCCQQVCCMVGLQPGHTYLFTDSASAAAAVSGGTGGGGSRESRELSEVLMRASATRGQIPVVTPSGATARASVLFVVPSPNADEPVLVFPPFPPAYTSTADDSVRTSAGPTAASGTALNQSLQPALLMEEDPPAYTTVDRNPARGVPVDCGDGAVSRAGRQNATSTQRVALRPRQRSARRGGRPHSVAVSARPPTSSDAERRPRGHHSDEGD